HPHLSCPAVPSALPSFPTRRSSDLTSNALATTSILPVAIFGLFVPVGRRRTLPVTARTHSLRNDAARSKSSCAKSEGSKTVCVRSEEHTSELQSPDHIVCRLLLEKT